MQPHNVFSLVGKTVLITGAGGLLGPKHAEACLEFGAKVIMTDINVEKLRMCVAPLIEQYGSDNVIAEYMDVTLQSSIDSVITLHNPNVLINNAARDPKHVANNALENVNSRFETMPLQYWKNDLDVIVNGTFLCAQSFINNLLSKHITGSVINIASDLSVIAPDQRLYHNKDLTDDQQYVKPITYSAAKFAVLGMTKYLAVYFAEKNIRINCLSPAGIYANHSDDFVEKISNVIPMKRMGNINELKGAIVFLASEASSFMTGHNLLVDGGRTSW